MRSLLLSSSLFALASAVCHHGTALYSREESHAAAPKFGYTGGNGPVAWHTLDAAWGTCATGLYQSPVDIQPGAAYLKEVEGKELEFTLEDDYQGGELENLGTTIEVTNPRGSIVRDGTTYSLVQYHFHATSEHTLKEEAFALEVHFVFQTEDKSLSVVGVPIEIAGAGDVPSPFLTAVLEKADKIPEFEDKTETYPLNARDIVSHISKCSVYQYAGSLTTPPCTEGVAWNVAAEPLYILPSSYRKAKHVLGFNARFTQSAPGEANVMTLEAEAVDSQAEE